MNELALFAGGGGGILGGQLLGWHTVCAVEVESYPRKILLQRQLDGILPLFPIWDDIRTFDGRPWRGAVDIITGGFPCQDISAAGKGAGIDGERSGLWGEMARVVCEVRPEFVFVENSPMLTLRGIDRVLGDLASLGYNARWCVLGADSAGAPHKRERIWILAYSDKIRRERSRDTRTGRNGFEDCSKNVAYSYTMRESQPEGCKQNKRGRFSNESKKISYTNSQGLEKREGQRKDNEQKQPASFRGGCEWWKIDPADLPDTDKLNDDLGGHGASEVQRERSEKANVSGSKISDSTGQGLQNRPEIKMGRQEEIKESERPPSNGTDWKAQSRVGRVVDGCPNRIHRLKALGNAQVPAVVALAFIILSEGVLTNNLQ